MLVFTVLLVLFVVSSTVYATTDSWLVTIIVAVLFGLLLFGFIVVNEKENTRNKKCLDQGGVILELRKTKHVEYVCVDPKFIIEVK